MTRAEYNRLDEPLKGDLEREAVGLLERYGAEWFTTHKARLRDELSFVYGI